MLLNTIKWLSWLSAVGLLALLVLLVMITSRLGLPELIITLILARVISLPEWLIHSTQQKNTVKDRQ
jgi:hypothetical protein